MQQPTDNFSRFIQFVVSEELNRARPSLSQDVEKRLWAAAQFDVFMNTGAIPSFAHGDSTNTTGVGFSMVDDSEYVRVISQALQPLISWHGVTA